LNSAIFTECHAVAVPDLKLWLEFYRLVAARDFAGMAASSRALLSGEYYGEREDLLVYLLSAAIIGSYMQEQYGPAVSMWEEFVEVFGNPGLAPLYLKAAVASAYELVR
jgi:hypothetical protein